MIEGGYAPWVVRGLARSRDRSLDPWDRPYVYERPGRVHPDGFDVCSYGADGLPGGGGGDADICN